MNTSGRPTGRQQLPRILFAHSDSTVLQHFAVMARRQGWAAIGVPSSAELLRTISEATYDLVIADLEMSNGNTQQLLRDIRKHNESQPLLLVSARQPAEVVLTMLREGAVDVIEEPTSDIAARQFLAAIEAILSSSSPSEVVRSGAPWQAQFRTKDFSINLLQLPLIEWLADKGVIDATWRLKLKLAVQEAVTNAWEHGNLELRSQWREELLPDGTDRYSLEKMNRLAVSPFADRMLGIIMEYTDHTLSIMVNDEGPGFDYQKTQTTDPGKVVCHGRGFQIIAGTVDEFGFKQGGRCVWMRIRLPRRAQTSKEKE